MSRIMLSPVACLAVPYFSTLFHKRHDFRGKKFIEHKVFFDFLYNFVWNIPHSKNNSRDIIINVQMSVY